MATFDAIYGLSTAIKYLIKDNYPGSWGTLDISVVQPTAISNGIAGNKEGFTVSLYRVAVSGTQRPQTPRRDDKGRLFRPSRLVDLHYLITPWAATTDKQHQMLGWLINLLEDRGTLSSAQLNHLLTDPDTFGKLESVQLGFESMPLTDHFNLWDKLRTAFPASASCVARMVALDSMRPIDEPELVQTRKYAAYQEEQA
jgi:Pvc16 N-terminal domain